MKPVSLQAVVDEIGFLRDTVTAYINRKTGELRRSNVLVKMTIAGQSA
jgi:hypothetical protein